MGKYKEQIKRMYPSKTILKNILKVQIKITFLLFLLF